MKRFYIVENDSGTYLSTNEGLKFVKGFPSYSEILSKIAFYKSQGLMPVTKYETIEMIKSANKELNNGAPFKLSNHQILYKVTPRFIKKTKKEFLEDPYESETTSLNMFSRYLDDTVQECIYNQIIELYGKPYNYNIQRKIISFIKQNQCTFKYLKKINCDGDITDIHFYYIINDINKESYIVISVEDGIIVG